MNCWQGKSQLVLAPSHFQRITSCHWITAAMSWSHGIGDQSLDGRLHDSNNARMTYTAIGYQASYCRHAFITPSIVYDTHKLELDKLSFIHMKHSLCPATIRWSWRKRINLLLEWTTTGNINQPFFIHLDQCLSWHVTAAGYSGSTWDYEPSTCMSAHSYFICHSRIWHAHPTPVPTWSWLHVDIFEDYKGLDCMEQGNDYFLMQLWMKRDTAMDQFLEYIWHDDTRLTLWASIRTFIYICSFFITYLVSCLSFQLFYQVNIRYSIVLNVPWYN